MFLFLSCYYFFIPTRLHEMTAWIILLPPLCNTCGRQRNPFFHAQPSNTPRSTERAPIYTLSFRVCFYTCTYVYIYIYPLRANPWIARLWLPSCVLDFGLHSGRRRAKTKKATLGTARGPYWLFRPNIQPRRLLISYMVFNYVCKQTYYIDTLMSTTTTTLVWFVSFLVPSRLLAW